MKQNHKKLMSLLMCVIMMLTLSVPAFANFYAFDFADIQEPLESTKTEVLYDSCELDMGTMYLEENSEYRIVYIVFNAGYISYAVCYKDNPGVSHTGYYYPDGQNPGDDLGTASIYSPETNVEDAHIVELLLILEPENIVDFKSREAARAAILTEAEAVTFAESYAPGWKAPVNSRLIGQSWEYPVTVSVYEHVNGCCTEQNILRYYANDTIVSIASVFLKLNATKIMNVVSNVFKAGFDYVAQQNGTLTYFEIDNTRTKTARIDGQTWYWAGWDRTYCVYSGDKATRVEIIWDVAHSDYDEGVSYYARKAYDSYLDQ